MGKIKIRLFPDGSIKMDTEGIKGKKCTDYVKVLEKLADAKIEHIEKTHEYYEEELYTIQENLQKIRRLD